MAILYTVILLFCTTLLPIIPTSNAVETEYVLDNLSQSGKEVQIQFKEDDFNVSARFIHNLPVFQNICKCSIKDVKCECCFTLEMLHDKPCCLKIQYFNEKKTVNVVVNYASKEVVNLKAVASTKEQPLQACFDMTRGWAKTCFKFGGVRWNSKAKELEMCSIFELYVLNKQAISTEFACFKFGVHSAIAIISKPFG